MYGFKAYDCNNDNIMNMYLLESSFYNGVSQVIVTSNVQ